MPPKIRTGKLKKHLNKSNVEGLVIKQLFEEEIERLEEDVNFLNKKNEWDAARLARHKMLGVQGIWAVLRQKGIAL